MNLSLPNSEDKQAVRLDIHKECLELAAYSNKALTMLWLSRDDFSDVLPIMHITKKITVPESIYEHWAAKKAWVSSHLLQNKIELPSRVTTMESMVLDLKSSVDVVNADFCGHYHTLTECMVASLMRYGLSQDSLFFMTVRNASQSAKSKYRAHLGLGLDAVHRRVLTYASLNERPIKTLPGFPKCYLNESDRGTSTMYTFGYRLGRE